MTEPLGLQDFVTTRPERRQIAQVLHFPADIGQYVDWPSVAQRARETGAHIEARNGDDGSWMIVLFWAYTDKVCEA